MKTKETWKINRSEDFTDIEKINAHLEIQKDGYARALKDNEHHFLCKPMSSFKFLFKRYPLMIVPTIILSLAFLWLHPIAFFVYGLFTISIFTIAVRHCGISAMAKYIFIFWVLHLVINFFILGGGSIEALSISIMQRHSYIQSLFFGMLLTHTWVYVLIFFQQYYHVFNIVEEEDGEEIATNWYIWKGCSLCNSTYNPFTDNCGES